MNWKLGLLALAVCGATALVVGLAIGGHGQATKMSTEVVRITRTTTTVAPVEPTETTPSPPAAKTSGHTGASAAKRSKSTPSARRTSRAKLPLEGATISVDPGHNGGNFSHPEEIGRLVPEGANGTTKACNTTGTATSDGSLTEAQFNWDVARELVGRLEGLGARVVLTRHSNGGVGPCVNERAEIANHAHAAAAVSIHADGNLAEGAHGFDVIHAPTEEMVAPAMAGPSLRLAEAERDALVSAGVPPANYVGEGGLDERSDLAGLNLAEVPAVLVDGNMREPEEAARLEDPVYRRKLAGALAAGIVSFLHGS